MVHRISIFLYICSNSWFMGFDDFLIKVILELAIPSMAFLKWYWKHTNKKFIKLSESGIEMRLNQWEKIMFTVVFKPIENGVCLEKLKEVK